MKERLHSVFETASDLIGADEITDVLARITDRAAIEIRAPRYLLAITTPGGQLHYHHRGFDQQEAVGCAQTILHNHADALPESWLVVPVRSSRRDYGRLLALMKPAVASLLRNASCWRSTPDMPPAPWTARPR